MMSKILSVAGFLCVLSLTGMERPADYGHNQLIKAIWAQDINAITTLLKSDINPNYFADPKRSDLALTQAVRTVNPMIVQLLLQFSADPSIDQNILCTAYMAGPSAYEDPIVFSERRFKVMELLIKDQRTNLNCIDDEGNTLLIKAVKARFDKLIKLLLSKSERLDMTIKNKEGKAVQDYTNKKLQKLFEGAFQSTPVRKIPEKMAANPEIIKEPVKVAPPQPPASTVDPRVQLFNAIASKNTQAIIDILNTGLNPNASITATNLSPLMVAATINSVPAMKILLHTQFIDPNKKNKDGDTALIIATRAGAVEAVAELLEHQEIIDNINLVNNKGLTALDEANEKPYGHWIAIAQILFAKGGITNKETFDASIYAKLGLSSNATPKQILGFAPTSAPSQDEIRKAYRRLTISWHPDKNNDSKAAEVTKLINWAYKQLTEASQ